MGALTAWLKNLVALASSVKEAIGILIGLGGLAVPYFIGLPFWALVTIVAVSVAVVTTGLWMAYQRLLRYVPLEKAATYAYERLDGTLVAIAAERMHDKASPENTLSHMKVWLGVSLAVYGTKPPSTVLQLIPADRVRRGHMNGDILESSDPKEPAYTDLAVKRLDLWWLVRDRAKHN